MKKNRVCLVSTVREPVAFESFLKYHLATGFERLYIFFDDPNDPACQIAKSIDGVVAIPCDGRLRRQWRSLRVYDQLKDYMDVQVETRQVFNANLAMKFAIEDGFDWIFHIDSDELVYNKFHWPIGKILAGVPENVLKINCFNNEAVVQSMDIENPFTEIKFFKKNRRFLSPKNQQQNKIFDKYFTNPEREYFTAYGHGKAAARVRPDLYPAIHNFKKETSRGTLHIFNGPTSGFLEPFEIEELVLYHYPMCGFLQYLNKYKLLGNFVLPPFNPYPKESLHLQSRAAYTSKNFTALKDIYKKRVQFSDSEGVKQLLMAEIFEQNKYMSRLVGHFEATAQKKAS